MGILLRRRANTREVSFDKDTRGALWLSNTVAKLSTVTIDFSYSLVCHAEFYAALRLQVVGPRLIFRRGSKCNFVSSYPFEQLQIVIFLATFDVFMVPAPAQHCTHASQVVSTPRSRAPTQHCTHASQLVSTPRSRAP